MNILKTLTGVACGLMIAGALVPSLSPAAAADEGKKWVKLDFDRKLVNAKTDPDGVWKDSEIREDTRIGGQSTLNAAHYVTQEGTYIVSLFYNDVCGMSECPIRVLFTPKGKTAGKIVTPADYLVQACQSTDHYFIREDGSAIRGCGSVIDLTRSN